MYVSPVLEYILWVDVIHGLSLQTSVGEFCLWILVVKAVTRGHAHHPLQVLQQPWRVVMVRQYRLPGGQEGIGRTMLELEKVHIVRLMHSPFNSPVWPVKKSDGTWQMTVDYRELNEVTPPLHAAVPSIHDLMDHLTVLLRMYHYVVDMANPFFSIDIALECQEQFAFT
ncbi:hypothetical protein mRhiFer1_007874 [Rhinolophus ferrumequinum]|uniref:Uncharacterized protein n=1 Tax=Rhinolophus ferrumequinum TaxID=59479 RepID=A0A7J8AW03_RHIFE|nr:hypothetical protein mRhiFer1_007874 [Rhinolophus ferrumequinum]